MNLISISYIDDVLQESYAKGKDHISTSCGGIQGASFIHLGESNMYLQWASHIASQSSTYPCDLIVII